MRTKKRNALFGRYPSCDMLNNALRFIYDGRIEVGCSEIVFAIEKAGGYFHEDLKEKVMMCLKGGFIIYGTKKD